VRLRDVADIGPEKTPNIIARENAQRKAVISCNVADGYNLGDLVAQVKARVEPIVNREGSIVEFGGQFEAQQSASRTLLVAGAAISIVMLLLLQLSTGSFRVGLLVMINLPLATIGGIAAVFITDSILHAGGGAGLVSNTLALFGLGSSMFLAPLAVVVLGGLLTSTFLNLIVVPAGYALVRGVKPSESASAEFSASTSMLGRVARALSLGQR
jgi:Cu/Ag efflux pump CusA